MVFSQEKKNFLNSESNQIKSIIYRIQFNEIGEKYLWKIEGRNEDIISFEIRISLVKI